MAFDWGRGASYRTKVRMSNVAATFVCTAMKRLRCYSDQPLILDGVTVITTKFILDRICSA